MSLITAANYEYQAALKKSTRKRRIEVNDLVILKPEILTGYQQKNAYGKMELCGMFSITPHTLKNILAGEPVRLFIAKRIAAALEIETPRLIQSWK
jgi:hypothetical protein